MGWIQRVCEKEISKTGTTEMIEIILIIVLVTLFAFLGGYREVQILVERGSWKWEDYKKNWYWFTDQNDKDKSNWDSFHVSNGILTVLVSILITLVLFFALDLVWWWFFVIPAPTWIFIMQIRNLTMHKILKK